MINWWSAFRQMRRRGVLGINRRNAACILDRNPSSRLAIVDDKLLMAELCSRIGVPSPAIIGSIARHGDLRLLEPLLHGHDEFVIKPARGSGGRGIVVVCGREGGRFRTANGRSIDVDGLRAHGADVLSGLFSLGGQADRLILQERVRPHPAFAPVAPQGVADIRIVLYRFEPAMAMVRLPTLASNGRANLHQGGIGVGIDLASGRTHHAVHGGRFVSLHPDTGEPLLDRVVPQWEAVVETARKTARAIGLGFVGVDIVLDEVKGPLLLEANARPGLAIQLANNAGLRGKIDEIDRHCQAAAPPSSELFSSNY